MANIDESSVRLPKTAQRINTALKYKTDVGSRKTAVFFWLDQGLPRMAVRYLAKTKLGHSTIAITADLYTHVAPGLQAVAVESFAEKMRQVGIDGTTNLSPVRTLEG